MPRPPRHQRTVLQANMARAAGGNDILAYFISRSPPCQSQAVVNDLRALQKVNDKNVSSWLCNYHVKHFERIDDVLLVPAGQVDQDNFADPTTGIVYNVNHVAKTLTKTKKTIKTDAKYDKVRAALQDAVDVYVNRTYAQGKGLGRVYVTNKGQVDVYIKGESAALHNFWAGSWASHFSLDLSTGVVDGSTKCIVHYFEDGNVQLHGQKQHADQIDANVGDPASTASSLVACIAAQEGAYQAALHKMYASMKGETFKGLRRFLPVTRQKMNWNQTVHAMAAELHG